MFDILYYVTVPICIPKDITILRLYLSYCYNTMIDINDIVIIIIRWEWEHHKNYYEYPHQSIFLISPKIYEFNNIKLCPLRLKATGKLYVIYFHLSVSKQLLFSVVLTSK